MARKELLIVGAGITGSLSAYLLSKGAGATSPNISVWETSREMGGRLATHSHPKDPSLHVDMGAQYLSRFMQETGKQQDEEFSLLRDGVYADLISNDILTPLQGTIEGQRSDLVHSVLMNYVAPSGMNSVAKYFLNRTSASVTFSRQLVKVDVDNLSRKVFCTTSSGEQAVFDSLVLTMPVPEILALHGNFLVSTSHEILKNLKMVQYSSRYAFGLFYEPNTAACIPETNWCAKYFDNPIVRFTCWDPMKRGSPANGKALLVHTGVPFGLEHLESEKDSVKDLVLKVLDSLIPGLPSPDYCHSIRWRYSQVFCPYPGSPGSVVLSHDPLVVAAGDGFVSSNFENCLLSAFVTTKMITCS